MREGNPMELTVLAPGVANSTDLRFRKSGMTHSQSQFDSDGTGEKRSDYAIDGIPNSSSFGGNQGVTVAYAPPAVSVQEFRVQTATYDASMGNTPGAVVNVMTKAGTSGFHGDLQYKFRSSQLDGESIFDQRAGFAKKEYSDHLYAAALGGPIRQNKTFFFVAFEGNNYGVPRSQGAITVPTEKMRNGDFSDLLKLGPQYQIYDPATIRPDPSNPGRFIRSPLPGNIIPANRIDPVAKKIVDYWDLPNVSGTADGRDNVQVPNFVEEQTNYTVTSRFDHNFSDKHRMYARLSWSWWQNVKDDFYGNEAAASPRNAGTRCLRRRHLYVLEQRRAQHPRGIHLAGLPAGRRGVRLRPGVARLRSVRRRPLPQGGRHVPAGRGRAEQPDALRRRPSRAWAVSTG